LADKDLKYLTKILKILKIFIKTTTKFQAKKYPTIYYFIPEIYIIYKNLELIQKKLNINIDFYYSRVTE